MTQPSDEVIGKVIELSPEGWPIIAVAVVAVLVVLAKWWLPEWRKDREGRRELERRRLELDAKAQEDSDSQARDRIRLTERQLDIQADQTRAMEALASQMAVINANFDASAKRSAGMGEKVDRIDATATENNSILKRIDRHLVGAEVTD